LLLGAGKPCGLSERIHYAAHLRAEELLKLRVLRKRHLLYRIEPLLLGVCHPSNLRERIHHAAQLRAQERLRLRVLREGVLYEELLPGGCESVRAAKRLLRYLAEAELLEPRELRERVHARAAGEHLQRERVLAYLPGRLLDALKALHFTACQRRDERPLELRRAARQLPTQGGGQRATQARKFVRRRVDHARRRSLFAEQRPLQSAHLDPRRLTAVNLHTVPSDRSNSYTSPRATARPSASTSQRKPLGRW